MELRDEQGRSTTPAPPKDSEVPPDVAKRARAYCELRSWGLTFEEIRFLWNDAMAFAP